MAHFRCRCGKSEAFGPDPDEGRSPIHHSLCSSCGDALVVVVPEPDPVPADPNVPPVTPPTA